MPISPARRPVLVGEDNPYGSDPRFALYPAPDGCSGWRLCVRVLGMRRTDYLREFRRANLCAERWSAAEARETAERLSVQMFCGTERVFIALGSKVAAAFGVPYAPFAARTCGHGRVLVLPHPSGRCRTWGEPGAFLRAREAVAVFLPDIAHLIGVTDHA